MSVTPAKISLIIVVRNAVSTIEAAIQSIISQDYPNFELVIIDGLSTDGTLEIIEKYSSDIAYFKSEKDEGIYDAMNKSIPHCSGDWIYFLGADDELYSDTVLTQLFSKPAQKTDIIYGNAYYTHRKKVRFGKVSRYMMSKHNINHQTIFYPKAVFQQYAFDLRYRVVADYYLNLQLFFKSEFHFKYLPITVARFNDQGTSGVSADLQFDLDKAHIIKSIFPTDVYLFYKARLLFTAIRDGLKSS